MSDNDTYGRNGSPLDNMPPAPAPVPPAPQTQQAQEPNDANAPQQSANYPQSVGYQQQQYATNADMPPTQSQPPVSNDGTGTYADGTAPVKVMKPQLLSTGEKVGYTVLCAFTGAIGLLIIWFINRNEPDARMKECFKFGFIGFAIEIAVCILLLVFVFGLAFFTIAMIAASVA